MFQLSEKTWALLGRIAIILTLIATPLGLITVCQRHPSAALKARIEYGVFAVPDDMSGYDDKIGEALSYRTLSEQLKLDFISEDLTRSRTISAIAEYVSNTRTKLRPGRAGSCPMLYVATIRNEGDRLAKSVRLETPALVAARVTRSNGQVKFAYNKEVVEIGDVNVQESVTVLGWAYGGPYQTPQLAHADGVGKVSVFEPMSPFWSGVRRSVWLWPGIIWMFFFLIYGGIRLVKNIRMRAATYGAKGRN